MSHKPAKVVAVFLAEFDMKKGYNLVWKHTRGDIDLSGVDYKVLPLGIHEFTEARVVFTLPKKEGEWYYGVSQFKQFVTGDSSNRDNVHMYSLGVVCEPRTTPWRPNQFIENGWEYFDSLTTTLNQYYARKSEEVLEDLYSKLTGLAPPGGDKVVFKHHMLAQFPAFITKVGPLVFPLFKQALLRKRILVFNNDHHSRLGTDYYSTYAFDYLLSLLSIIPTDVRAAGSTVDDYYSQPLFNVGLNQPFAQEKGFIATTNDDILKFDKRSSDVVVLLNGTGHATMHMTNDTEGTQLGPQIKASRRDCRRLRRLLSHVEPEGQADLALALSSTATDDMRLIHSVVSTYDDDDETLVVSGLFPCDAGREPAWWTSEASYPVLWRELLWLAFAWFASAGQAADDIVAETETPGPHLRKMDFLGLITIVGYFHAITRRWFSLVNEIIDDQVHELGYDELRQVSGKLQVTVTYHDLTEMDLDPYSLADHEFIKEFVLKYYGDVVDEVEIGMGLGRICC